MLLFCHLSLSGHAIQIFSQTCLVQTSTLLMCITTNLLCSTISVTTNLIFPFRHDARMPHENACRVKLERLWTYCKPVRFNCISDRYEPFPSHPATKAHCHTSTEFQCECTDDIIYTISGFKPLNRNVFITEQNRIFAGDRDNIVCEHGLRCDFHWSL